MIKTITNKYGQIENKTLFGSKDLVILDDIKTIGSYAYYGYKETSITLHKNISRVENCAFYQSRPLKSIVFPTSGTYIDSDFTNYSCNYYYL